MQITQYVNWCQNVLYCVWKSNNLIISRSSICETLILLFHYFYDWSRRSGFLTQDDRVTQPDVWFLPLSPRAPLPPRRRPAAPSDPRASAACRTQQDSVSHTAAEPLQGHNCHSSSAPAFIQGHHVLEISAALLGSQDIDRVCLGQTSAPLWRTLK